MSNDNEFRWGQFLDERRRLIHYYHSEGKTDVEICDLLSMNPVQVAMIRNGTRPGPKNEV